MTHQVARPPRLEGRLRVPGDKSISHRAALFNGVAHGKARVVNFSRGADCLSTLGCLRALGVRWDWDPAGAGPHASDLLVLDGAGEEGLREPDDLLDAGNSGTTMRLLTGLLAGYDLFAVLSGDQSLRRRPMGRVVQPLRRMGARISGRGGDTLAPLAIHGGHLQGLDYETPVASAQLKSALLLAALRAEGPSRITEPALSRDHSERMLAAMGARLVRKALTIEVQPLTGPLRATDFIVPGDFSAAAFWLVAGAIHPEARLTVEGVGINPTRTGLLDVLQAMGARIHRENEREVGGEPIADLTVESSRLEGVEVAGDLIPRLIDEVPVLAVAAACAHGQTVVRDAAELRVKESDRIATVALELGRLGAQIEELRDGLVIRGPTVLRGARCQDHGDHRLAMALAVAGLAAAGDTLIEGDSHAVSYPAFWQQLDQLAGDARASLTPGR